MVPLHPLAVRALADVHGCPARDQFGEQAGVLWRKVLHEHEGHPAVGWHRCKKMLERLQPSGRRPDPDDQEGLLTWSCRRGVSGRPDR
jgi:hypothetical protein